MKIPPLPAHQHAASMAAWASSTAGPRPTNDGPPLRGNGPPERMRSFAVAWPPPRPSWRRAEKRRDRPAEPRPHAPVGLSIYPSAPVGARLPASVWAAGNGFSPSTACCSCARRAPIRIGGVTAARRARSTESPASRPGTCRSRSDNLSRKLLMLAAVEQAGALIHWSAPGCRRQA